jgi:hypothetical protein
MDFSSLINAGASAATGNYVGAGIQAVGFGLSLFGQNQQAQNAKAQAKVSMDIASKELAINEQKRLAMELNARRQQMEIFRNTQRARAQATQAATTQGASLGSGLQGGLAEVAGQGLFNLFGVNQALYTGENIAANNNLISQDKIKLAELGGDAADAQGLTSLGNSIMKVGPTVGQFSTGFNFSSFFGTGGNYSGTPGASNTGGIY